MTNKVYTELHIQGLALEIDRLVATVFTPESDFSFERILPAVPDAVRPETWGTRGDCWELLTHRENANRLDVRFTTAWAYPEGVIKALCRAFPLLRVDGHISEEFGNFECDIVNGDIVPVPETWRDRAEAEYESERNQKAEQVVSPRETLGHRRIVCKSSTPRTFQAALQNIVDYLHEEAADARSVNCDGTGTHIDVSVIRIICWLRRSRPRRLRIRRERPNLHPSRARDDDKLKGGL